jgi:coenzyme F420-reducing hydrogenase beta subunit
LRAGKNVLFVGTPCQIAGLYGFFGNNPAGLYTCDLVCHGVNSLAVFKAYLSYTGKRLRHSIESVDFRVKIPSWEVPSVGLYYRGGENIVKVNEDPFYRGFLHNYYLRLSCYNCRYNTLPRIGDITLGDFWCWDKRYRPENFNPKGTSLVIINNDKGKELFLKVSKDKLNVAIADLYKTVLYNPFIKTCAEYPHDFFKRKEIFSLVRQHKYRELFGKQLSPRYKLKDRMRKYLRLYKEKLVKLKR